MVYIRVAIVSDFERMYGMSLGEIYQGVELELMAFTDGYNRLFTLSPGGRPETIKINLEGSKELKVHESGMLEVATDGASAQFTKPYAYQVSDGVKKPVEVSYRIIKDGSYGFNVGEYDKNKPLMIYSNMPGGKDQ